LINAVSLLAALTLVAANAAPDASPSPPAPSATQIYLSAVHEMRALAAQGAPPYLVFDLHIDSHNLHWYPEMTNGDASWDAKLVHANELDDYRVWYRTKDQRALVQDEKTGAEYRGDAPFAPDAKVFTDMTSPSPTPSPLPLPSPSPSPTSGSLNVGTSEGSAEVIGAVTVDASKDYDVTLVGVEDRAGVPVYHIHLHAIRDALDNPLTDMWVDTHDSRVWAVHGEVTIRAVAAGFGIGIDADWAPVAERWLVTGVGFAGKGYVMVWHINVASTMTTKIVSVPASLPDDYFAK
jgi:hypothetical protein